MALTERSPADLIDARNASLSPRGQRLAAAAERRRSAVEESRRSFLRLMSHELRTPLNSILGFSEIIASELYGPVGDPRYAAHAGLIRESGQQLLQLINQIVEIARLEAGAADLHITPEPALEACADAVRMLSREAVASGVSVQIGEAPPELNVLCDPRGLKRVLTNLLHNAISFAPRDSVVSLTLRMEARRAVFRISDCGEGVATEDLPRLLRPFEQGENALVRQSNGAGLGLPMAKLLCEAMGGTLAIASRKGEGFTATVKLPLAPIRSVAD